MSPPALNGTSSPSGIAKRNSLINVALLSLEVTVNCHFLTPNTEAGISISISWRTQNWHAKRQPSRTSRLVRLPNSVGKTSPPPLVTLQRHWPHAPPPPQAEGINIP